MSKTGYEGPYRPGSANIDEAIEYPGGNSLGRLVQVGLWPDDTSVFGVQDLIGNAHDWCADEPRPGHRAYRGGCFLSAPLRADIETASSIAADTRVPTIGFRVVAPAAVSADPDGQDRNET